MTGRSARPGEWSIERHAFAQRIVHVEDACKSVLEAIRKLDDAPFDADLGQIERDLSAASSSFWGRCGRLQIRSTSRRCGGIVVHLGA